MTQQLELGYQIQVGQAFSPTAPIDERKLFAGRSDQVVSLLRIIAQKGQHAILFGERGVGKTSLANVLSSFMGGAVNVVAPRINCDGQDTFETVWRKVLDEIQLTRKINPVGFTPSSNTEVFATSDLLTDNVTPESIRRTLSMISHGVLPILIIDEFDRLPQTVKRQMADTVKTLSDHAVNVTVVLVGVADSVGELIDEHESIERALIQIPMPRMTTDEIKAIIDTGLGLLGLGIDEQTMTRMTTLAQGLPHYAHLLGFHAAEIAIGSHQKNVTAEIADRAITVAIDGAQQSIKSAWHKATSSPRKDNLFAEVLIACALAKTDDLGYFAAQDVRDPLRSILGRQIDIANYAQHLADFCGDKKGAVLQRIGESRKYRFRFSNHLFQPYVVMQGFATNRVKH